MDEEDADDSLDLKVNLLLPPAEDISRPRYMLSLAPQISYSITLDCVNLSGSSESFGNLQKICGRRDDSYFPQRIFCNLCYESEKETLDVIYVYNTLIILSSAANS